MRTVANNFLDLLRGSMMVQGFVTLVLVSACGYLWFTSQAVPKDLQNALLIVMCFYFGTKTISTILKGLR